MKTYIKPTTNEIHVRIQPLMEFSRPSSVSGLGDDFGGVSSEEYGGGTADSRDGSLWNDED